MALFPAIYALNVLAVFGLAAYLFQFERLYLIAVLFALPVPVDALVRAWLGIRLGFWAFAVPALIILAMGVILLMRFLRDYSVPVEDDNERG
jgi:ABC-type glycerol-3-phosphate transport system permease component